MGRNEIVVGDGGYDGSDSRTRRRFDASRLRLHERKGRRASVEQVEARTRNRMARDALWCSGHARELTAGSVDRDEEDDVARGTSATIGGERGFERCARM